MQNPTEDKKGLKFINTTQKVRHKRRHKRRVKNSKPNKNTFQKNVERKLFKRAYVALIKHYEEDIEYMYRLLKKKFYYNLFM